MLLLALQVTQIAGYRGYMTALGVEDVPRDLGFFHFSSYALSVQSMLFVYFRIVQEV